jgi:hypothetical protein
MAGKGISGEDIDGRLFSLGAKEKPQPPGQGLVDPLTVGSVALTKELQQRRKQLEVQVKRQSQ